MARKVVILNENCFGFSGGAVLGRCRVCGGSLDSRSDVFDYGRDHDRSGYSWVGCRDLWVQGRSSDGGPLVGTRAKAGVVKAARAALCRVLLTTLALSLCLFWWVDVIWAAVPTLVKVMPESIVAGSQGVSLAVQGTRIDAATVVKWGVTSLTTTVYGDSAAVAIVPDSLVESVGMGVVSLENVKGASNMIGIPVVESIATQLEPVLYVAAGLLGAMAFIYGVSQRWS